ncbi:hypothetical protein NDU88_001841 [Pleurodeles waltl]|uniref:Uncharacterized protein n=1 Tax=Pleurodeles waltl TaxID=8319 RepID=A0AAV7P733_PLEWA|nr:hypothetical protein NDU88_001841 [Pleurodeles waltl]
MMHCSQRQQHRYTGAGLQEGMMYCSWRQQHQSTGARAELQGVDDVLQPDGVAAQHWGWAAGVNDVLQLEAAALQHWAGCRDG